MKGLGNSPYHAYIVRVFALALMASAATACSRGTHEPDRPTPGPTQPMQQPESTPSVNTESTPAPGPKASQENNKDKSGPVQATVPGPVVIPMPTPATPTPPANNKSAANPAPEAVKVPGAIVAPVVVAPAPQATAPKVADATVTSDAQVVETLNAYAKEGSPVTSEQIYAVMPGKNQLTRDLADFYAESDKTLAGNRARKLMETVLLNPKREMAIEKIAINNIEFIASPLFRKEHAKKLELLKAAAADVQSDARWSEIKDEAVIGAMSVGIPAVLGGAAAGVLGGEKMAPKIQALMDKAPKSASDVKTIASDLWGKGSTNTKEFVSSVLQSTKKTSAEAMATSKYAVSPLKQASEELADLINDSTLVKEANFAPFNNHPSYESGYQKTNLSRVDMQLLDEDDQGKKILVQRTNADGSAVLDDNQQPVMDAKFRVAMRIKPGAKLPTSYVASEPMEKTTAQQIIDRAQANMPKVEEKTAEIVTPAGQVIDSGLSTEESQAIVTRELETAVGEREIVNDADAAKVFEDLAPLPPETSELPATVDEATDKAVEKTEQVASTIKDKLVAGKDALVAGKDATVEGLKNAGQKLKGTASEIAHKPAVEKTVAAVSAVPKKANAAAKTVLNDYNKSAGILGAKRFALTGAGIYGTWLAWVHTTDNERSRKMDTSDVELTSLRPEFDMKTPLLAPKEQGK